MGETSSCDFISALRSCIRFGFSNDITGLFGRTDIAQEFYMRTLLHAGSMLGTDLSNHQIGTEALAIRKKIAPQLHKKRKIPIIGLHGKTGPENLHRFLYDPFDSVLITAIGALFHTTDEVAALSNTHHIIGFDQHPYVLVHELEAWAVLKESRKNHLSFPNKEVTYAVENHSYHGSSLKGRAAVAEILQRDGTAVSVFDLVHFIHPLLGDGHSYREVWKAMLEELHKHGKCLVHLPIGTYQKDSLDFTQIDTSMWTDLATQLRKQDCFIILEHLLDGTVRRLYGNTIVNDKRLIYSTADKIRLLYEIGIPGLRE